MTTSGNNRSAVEAATSGAIAANDCTQTDPVSPQDHQHVAQDAVAPENDLSEERAAEHGGQAGLEPTRYGDWEKKGRCTDF